MLAPFEVKTSHESAEASKEAMGFIQSLTPDKTLALKGKDELKVMSLSSVEDASLGSYEVTITTVVMANSPVIKVAKKSFFKSKGLERFRVLACNLRASLDLIELHAESHLQAKYHLVKELNVVSDEEKLLVQLEYTIEGRQQSFNNYLVDEDKKQQFMFSGQRYLLLKLFVHRGSVPANMNFIELDSSNELVISQYEDLGRFKVNVDNAWVETIGIERKLLNKKYTDVARYFFDETGVLLLRIEPGSDIYMAHPLLKSHDSVKAFFVDESKAKVDFEWEKDIEMRSIFESLKERIGSDLSKQAYRRPEWRGLMADFLQQLLMDKPADVLEYSISYFNSNS